VLPQLTAEPVPDEEQPVNTAAAAAVTAAAVTAAAAAVHSEAGIRVTR